MEGQGFVARGDGYGPRMVRPVRRVLPSQVVKEGVGEWPEEAGVAGRGGGSLGCGLRAVVHLRTTQWGQWVRQCAAPWQTQWSGFQSRGVCGSRWHTQRGHAVASVGGTCGRMVARGHGGLWCAHAGWWVCRACGARACRVGVVRGGWCTGWGEGPASGGRSLGGVSRFVEQEFEEVGLVCQGYGGRMLQEFLVAVCELFGRFGNGRPLHVRCRDLGVVRLYA